LARVGSELPRHRIAPGVGTDLDFEAGLGHRQLPQLRLYSAGQIGRGRSPGQPETLRGVLQLGLGLAVLGVELGRPTVVRYQLVQPAPGILAIAHGGNERLAVLPSNLGQELATGADGR